MKNEEKAPSDTNKKRKGLSSRNIVCREAFSGKSKALNTLQVKFDCRYGNEGRRFLKCLPLATAYLIKNLECGGDDVKTSICNGKVFEPVWPDPVGPNPAATKAML